MTLLKGVLKNAFGEPMPNHTILFTALRNTQTVLNTVISAIVTSDNGSYEKSIYQGRYQIDIFKDGLQKTTVGVIELYADSPDADINTYLTLPGESEVTPEFIQQVIELKNLAIDASDKAVVSASEAKESELIASDAASKAGISEQNAKSSADNSALSAAASDSSASDAEGFKNQSSESAQQSADSAAQAMSYNESAESHAQAASLSEQEANQSKQSAADSAAAAAESAANIGNAVFNKGSLASLNINTLGDISAKGVYYQPTASNATTANGYPTGAGAGTLDIKPLTSTKGVIQTYTSYDNNNIWVRSVLGSWNGSNGPWSDWIVFYTSANKPKATDITYKFNSALTQTQAQPLSSVLSSFVRIEDFYLDSDNGDYALAFNRAALHYKDSAGMAIIFGPNTYNFNTRAIYDGTANIILIGQGSSTINLNSTLNAANLSIKSVRKITIENIEFNVAEPASGTKVAIYANSTGQDQSHNFRNVRVVPNIVTSGKGIICYDIVNPALSSFYSCYTRYFGTSLVSASNNISWRISANSKISTDSMFINCAIVGGEIAYLATPPVLGTNGAALEGITWVSCTVVGSLEGVIIQGDASNGYKSPMYRWIGGHISTYKRCFFAYWVSQLSLTDFFFYLTYDASLSGSGGLFPIFFEQCIEQRVHNGSLHLFGQEAYTGSEVSQGVHVGPGCRFTSVRDVSTYTPAKALGVATYPGSSITRVRDCVTFYSGAAPAAVFSFAGSGDVDLGGNNVYAS